MKREGCEYSEVLYVRVKRVEMETFQHAASIDGEANLSKWVRRSLQESAKNAAGELLEEV